MYSVKNSVFPKVLDGERVMCQCASAYDANTVAKALNLYRRIKKSPYLFNGDIESYTKEEDVSYKMPEQTDTVNKCWASLLGLSKKQKQEVVTILQKRVTNERG